LVAFADGLLRGSSFEIHQMSAPLAQHQAEIQQNLQAWNNKPLLREIYAGFYARILALVDPALPGRIVEIGSGIGNLKTHLPRAVATDLFPNPWLDLVCDAYDLPFATASISHLVLFDVFHHLAAPNAFLKEAARVLIKSGRVILFEPYISWFSWPVYGLLHQEPITSDQAVNMGDSLPRPRSYYAAQGNATRLFFAQRIPNWPSGWEVFYASAFSCFHYLLSGGYSKRALYPQAWLTALRSFDQTLSHLPALFGGRCLIGLRNLRE
jgi:SAM-dependent methyltransferase